VEIDTGQDTSSGFSRSYVATWRSSLTTFLKPVPLSERRGDAASGSARSLKTEHYDAPVVRTYEFALFFSFSVSGERTLRTLGLGQLCRVSRLKTGRCVGSAAAVVPT